MRLKSTLAVISVISVAVALGLASQSPAEAGWCRAPRGFCGPQPVRHYIYYPFARYFHGAMLGRRGVIGRGQGASSHD